MQPKGEAQKWLSSIVDEEPWWEARKAKRYFDKFRELFSERGFDRLPKRRPWDHAIELVLDAKPANCKVYPISPLEQKELDTFIE